MIREKPSVSVLPKKAGQDQLKDPPRNVPDPLEILWGIPPMTSGIFVLLGMMLVFVLPQEIFKRFHAHRNRRSSPILNR